MPIRYDHALERPEPDEAETIEGLVAALRQIAETVHADSIADAREWLSAELTEGDIVLFTSSNGAGLAGLAEDVIADLQGASK